MSGGMGGEREECTFLVGRDERSKRGDLLQRGELVEAAEVECSDEGLQPFRTKSSRGSVGGA